MQVQNGGEKSGTGERSNMKVQVLPEQLPVLTVSELVLFPNMVVPLDVEKDDNIKTVEYAMSKDRLVVLAIADQQEKGSFLEIGTAALILRKVDISGGAIRLLLQGVSRVKILELLPPDPYAMATVTRLVDRRKKDNLEVDALTKQVRAVFNKFLELSPHIPRDVTSMLATIEEPGMLADLLASHLDVGMEKKVEILEAIEEKTRLKRLFTILSREVEVLELGNKIQSQVKGRMDRTQKEYYLREQLKAIRQELGDTDEESEFLAELGKRIEARNFTPDAKEEADREFNRLKRMSQASSEFMVAHTYIEWLLDVPWNETTEDNLDFVLAQRILDEDHCGLEMVKKRILEFLAVRKMKGDNKGPILCFIGPPGTGKTSMGKSIAKALGRKFYRFSLGGMRDEAEIRGHRRTYVGAMPGRIIQGLKRVATNNPVFMLDEIDKLGQDFRGDPASALLEVLDPEQNDTFVDHYLNVHFDLSRVLFITTANQRDTIPAPLYDRIEVIEIPGYTEEEKVDIAHRHLIPKQLAENGLTKHLLLFQRQAVSKIIRNHTRESGLRNLERRIAAVCRQVALKIASGETAEDARIIIKPSDIVAYLGPPKIFPEVAQRTSVPGVATGLAWTPTGGEILFVEASLMPGNKKLTLTGKLGEVMRESAQTALSLLRTQGKKLHLETNFFDNHDIHIHVPAGAIPKDGPSAGITILLALTSLLLNRPVRSDLAVTGEVTLRGLVLPVGGIKEKVLAAKRAGIKQIVLPRQNNYDLMRLSDQVKEGLTFHLINRADEAIALALVGKSPPGVKKDTSLRSEELPKAGKKDRPLMTGP